MKEGKVRFNRYDLRGWKCSCGEVYYNSEDAQRVLLLNKIKKVRYHTKLNKVKSNLILRIPKDVGDALQLEEGKEVTLVVKNKQIILQAD